jgi:nucleoside-diphosphate-sugar epimerase
MSHGMVIVSGATGFLGSRLCVRLAAEGYHVVGLKRSTSSLRRLADTAEEITLVDIDRITPAEALDCVGRPDAIVHAATCYGRDGESHAEVVAANHDLPLALLRAAASSGVETFVNSDTVLPSSAGTYAASKRRFLEEARPIVRAAGMRLINLRVQHMYGPGDDDGKFVTRVARACASGAPFLELTSGDQKRDFVYVEDVVDAYVLVLASRGALPAPCAELDVGSGTAMPVRDLVELIHRLAGSTTELRFGAVSQRPHEAELEAADVKALTTLGWRCRTSLAEGIAKVLETERAVT